MQHPPLPGVSPTSSVLGPVPDSVSPPVLTPSRPQRRPRLVPDPQVQTPTSTPCRPRSRPSFRARPRSQPRPESPSPSPNLSRGSVGEWSSVTLVGVGRVLRDCPRVPTERYQDLGERIHDSWLTLTSTSQERDRNPSLSPPSTYVHTPCTYVSLSSSPRPQRVSSSVGSSSSPPPQGVSVVTGSTKCSYSYFPLPPFP